MHKQVQGIVAGNDNSRSEFTHKYIQKNTYVKKIIIIIAQTSLIFLKLLLTALQQVNK